MTYAMEQMLDELKMEGKLEGKIEGKLEVAKTALLKGANVEFVADITGLSLEEVKKLSKDLLQ